MATSGKTLTKLTMFRLLLVLWLPIAVWLIVGVHQAYAEILLSEDWETTTINSDGKIGGWSGPANPSAMYIVTDPAKAHSGQNVLEMKYNPWGTGSSYMRFYPADKSRNDLYIRWYHKFSPNFSWTSKAIKMTRMYTTGHADFYLQQQWRDGKFRVVVQGTYGGQDSRFQQNVGTPYVFQKDKWECIEVYIKLNQGAASDGIVRAWLNGEKKLEYVNERFETDAGKTFTELMISGYYNDPNDLLMFAWIDDIVISTEQIGCLPDGKDTSPPNPPSGLRISSQ